MRDDIRLGYWVRFTDDGIPAWFGPAWVDGAEFVEGVDAETLITHRRVDGVWQLRPPPPEPEQQPEHAAPEPDPATLDIKAELAAIAERVAELQAALDVKP